jgi:mRNA-degrading endonuclease toxin of MazEF toxin-antitoxin module
MLPALPIWVRVRRPALIVQADLFNDIHGSITVVPLTSTIVDAPLFRITPDESAGPAGRGTSTTGRLDW